MNALMKDQRRASVRLSLVLAVVVGVVLAAAYFAGATHASAPNSGLKAAGGSTQQWAFGGNASASYACSNCLGSNISGAQLSFKYYIEWVVIFTQTNVSSSQTQIESQAALNATASLSFSGCVQNGSTCNQESASASLSGKETATGFTNITTATVNEISPTPGSIPALAITDASSNEAFNFSGSYSISVPGHSGSVSFDLGASETSGVSFGTPLGLVPVTPSPGEIWNSSAPFTAHGSWTSGYSISASGSAGGATESNWTKGTVSPSGTLTVNGTDLGAFTLWDNYTNPHSSVTAQEILLDFGNGTFAATDGYILIPFGIYGGVYAGLFGAAVSHAAPRPVTGAHPAASISTPPSGESAYYQKGVGFIGAAAAGNGTLPIGSGKGQSVAITAGPEPLSVAQQQYGAITSSSSSTSGFPWGYVIAGVVVVVVAVSLIILLSRRSRRRRAAAMVPPVAGAPTYAAPSGPGGPGGPTMTPAATATQPPAFPAPPTAPVAPAAPVCSTCGQPGTFISQYNRYYCYTDKRYL
jgi:hypothetical protein